MHERSTAREEQSDEPGCHTFQVTPIICGGMNVEIQYLHVNVTEVLQRLFCLK
jgi:hypothetical protein